MDTEATTDLRRIYAPVDEEMRLLAMFLKEELGSSQPFIWQILQHIAKFRGKQIRPALLFLTSKIGGAETTPDHVKIGAVIELIHTATLVHDDVLDEARLRRNMETVHRRWGERAAVLIGDYIYSRAFHLSTQVPGMAGILSDTTHTICEGELLQIGSRFRPDLDEATYFEIIRKKTAILYAVSCEIGGTLGGLEPDRCERLHDFGLELGMAFQIADDCLDYAGQEALVGKSLGTDLHQGKLTLPLIYLLESVSEAEARWLRGVLSAPLDPVAEARIVDLVRRHGVVPEAFARAEAFVQAGKAVLIETLNGDPGAAAVRESLDMIADYMVRRQR
ncbi:MAG: polyprenyl synthetase family protein [Planctomycetes bacterium]|nr:polyprenyl synthetase family protein [Planctomycetota bacterium]